MNDSDEEIRRRPVPCGATFMTKSNKEEIFIEVCNECHPFYTGKQGKTKKTGNIEKFNRKYGITEETAE